MQSPSLHTPGQLARASTTTESVQGPRLLLPRQSDLSSQDFDQLQRYGLTAQLLERLLGAGPFPVRVLEVGCNVLNLLPRFLDPERVQVVRCDVQPCSTDPEFILLEPGKPLPFTDGAFDAVVALEVLEHMPAEARHTFLADCLRVGQRGFIFTCPDGSPEVVEAESLAGRFYERLHGRPHPFLLEHQQCGLPAEEEVRRMLRDLDVPHAAFANTPLEVWLLMFVMAEDLQDRRTLADLQDYLQRSSFTCRQTGETLYYRKVYVCAKTFEATAALEPLPQTAVGLPALPGLQSLAASVSQRLCTLTERNLEIERLEAELRERERSVAELRTELNAAERDHERECEAHAAELSAWKQHAIVQRSFVYSLLRSWILNLTRPVRVLRWWLKPPSFDAGALIPWQHLERKPGAPEGTWQALEKDPQFLVPCFLPAGWVRVRLQMTTTVSSFLELFTDSGVGFNIQECLERVPVRDSMDLDFYARLPRPIQGLRLDPLDGEGEFCLDQLRIEAVPAPCVWWRALSAKWRQIRRDKSLVADLRQGLSLLLRGQWRQLGKRLRAGLPAPVRVPLGYYDSTEDYQLWRAERQLTDDDRARLRQEADALADPPLISVLMPVYNVPEKYLRLAIESVLRQTYSNWELCIADDGSTAPHVRRVLEEYAQREPRIKLTLQPRNAGISAASNAALALAQGDFLALLDHDDELAEHALSSVVRVLAADPSLDMIYSDEDKLEPTGQHIDPFFKPDWSPEFFLACMYTCHLGVYRSALVRSLGGFRSEYDYAQDYDLVLRVVAHTKRIHHITDVLYHWRKLDTSTANDHRAKPSADRAARRAIQEYLRTTGQHGLVEPGPIAGYHRVRYPLCGQPLVSIIIPSACTPTNPENPASSFLEKCVTSILECSTYRNFEILILDRQQMPADLARRLCHGPVRRISYDEPFNWSRINNLGARHATGAHLLFLNDDIEVISGDWLECLLEYSQLESIGAVGAKLLFPDERLQHAGVTIMPQGPIHHFYGCPGNHSGYFGSHLVQRNYSAVTGACLMTRSDVFRAVEGFFEELPLNFNDVDYCLKVLRGGWRVVCTPYAQLYHHEGMTKPGVFDDELQTFRQRWPEYSVCDPYYNPNLSTQVHDYRVARPQRRS